METQTLQKKYSWIGEDRIAYYDEGPGDAPTVLFVHGFPTSCYLWRLVLHSLSENWRCIAPDLVGLGDSWGPEDTDFSLHAQTKKIIRLVRHLEVDPVVVVGHDIGGIVAQIAAVRHTRFVRGFVLVNSACYDNWPVGPVRHLRALARNPVIYKMLCKTSMIETLARSQHGFRKGVRHPGSISDKQINEYLRPFLLSDSAKKRFRQFLLSLSSMESREIAHEFHRLNKHALLIWALDDPYFPLIWGERLATDIPNSTLNTISDCGHFVPEERPQRLSAMIEAYLYRVFEIPFGRISPVNTNSAGPNITTPE